MTNVNSTQGNDFYSIVLDVSFVYIVKVHVTLFLLLNVTYLLLLLVGIPKSPIRF